MRTLFCGYSYTTGAPDGSAFSTLGQTTPFGYDLIVVNPRSVSTFIGNGASAVNARWIDHLHRWLGGHHKLIVTLQPHDGANYAWLALRNFNPSQITEVGHTRYLGTITATDGYVKSFLSSNIGQFTVSAYYQPHDNHPEIVPNSIVDDGLLTSFSWKMDNKEIIFIPPAPLDVIYKFINALELGSTQWILKPAIELQEKINSIDEKIQHLENDKTTLTDELIAVNNKVNSLLEEDVYLNRSINSYSRTQSTDSPNPENFYEAIESIEKAFESERQMQQTLGVTKTTVDRVMRRTNEFRHVARTGKTPEPLTEQEKSDFSKAVQDIIQKYIEYLYQST
jgi:hypothetical protein